MLALNAMAERMAVAVWENGPGAVASLFGVSAVTWLALFCIWSIARDAHRPPPPRLVDFALVILAAVFSLAPLVQFSATGLFAFALLILSTAPANSPERRMAIIALALCAPLLWGPLALKLAGYELLALDGWIVSVLSGFRQFGNLVIGPDPDHTVLIYDRCSSLRDVSQVIVLLAILVQFLRIRLDLPLVLASVAAMLGVMLVNALRIAAIAHYPSSYETLHRGMGAAAFGWLSLLVILVCLIGGFRVARRVR